MSGHEHTPAVHEHVDSWHHHEAVEGKPQHEHAGVANPGLIARWFAGILVSVVGLIVIVSVYFVKYSSQMRAQRIETYTVMSQDARAARTAAEGTLGFNGVVAGYGWANRDTGAVQLPVGEAMKKVVKNYGAKK